MEKNTTVKIEPWRHRKLKIRAAMEGMSMKELLAEAVDDVLDKKDRDEQISIESGQGSRGSAKADPVAYEKAMDELRKNALKK